MLCFELIERYWLADLLSATFYSRTLSGHAGGRGDCGREERATRGAAPEAVRIQIGRGGPRPNRCRSRACAAAAIGLLLLGARRFLALVIMGIFLG